MQPFAIAAAGISAATERFEASGRRTAASPLADPAGEAVERISASHAVEANVAVMRTADDMIGTLLDVMV